MNKNQRDKMETAPAQRENLEQIMRKLEIKNAKRRKKDLYRFHMVHTLHSATVGLKKRWKGILTMKQENARSVKVENSAAAYPKGLLPPGLLLYILAQPSPKEPCVLPPPPQYGTCRCCGQPALAQLMGFKTQAEVDDYATEHCECADARRQANLQTARGKIERLFSDSAAAVREMLIENAELVQDEELQDVTVKLTSRIKCKVAKSPKGFLIITRTIADTQQETV